MMTLILSLGEIMSDSEDWDLPDLDSLMRGEKKHQWLSEPRFEKMFSEIEDGLQGVLGKGCLLYTSPSPRDRSLSRMPSSA